MEKAERMAGKLLLVCVNLLPKEGNLRLMTVRFFYGEHWNALFFLKQDFHRLIKLPGQGYSEFADLTGLIICGSIHGVRPKQPLRQLMKQDFTYPLNVLHGQQWAMVNRLTSSFMMKVTGSSVLSVIILPFV